MIFVRASRATLAGICPPSLIAPDIEIDTSGELARMGIAAHECGVSIVEDVPPDISKVARKWSVDAKDLDFLSRQFSRLWNYGSDDLTPAKDLFPSAMTEVSLPEVTVNGVTFTGTCDLLSYVPDQQQIRIGDTKTGYLETDAGTQLLVYARMALEEFPDAETVWLATFRTRLGILDSSEVYERSEVVEIIDRLAWRIANVKRYSPGGWCGYCPRSHSCPAKSALMVNTMKEIGLGDYFDILSTIPEVRAALMIPAVEVARTIGKKMEEFVKLAKADVESYGGTLADGNGNSLEIVEKGKREIDARIALPVLREHLSDDEILPCIEIGVGAMEDAVALASPKGMKGKNKKAVAEQLVKAGAMTTKFHRELKVVRSKDPIEVDGQAETASLE